MSTAWTFDHEKDYKFIFNDSFIHPNFSIPIYVTKFYLHKMVKHFDPTVGLARGSILNVKSR